MKHEDKDILLDFFTKGLSEEEKQYFLSKASHDPDFVKEFTKMSELNTVFEETFAENKGSGKKRKLPNKFRNLIFYTGAAAIILFGVFIAINRASFEKNPGLALFEEYYEPFDMSVIRSSASSNSYIYLYSLYVSRDYKTIATIDIEALELDEIKDMAYIMQGISLIEVEDFNGAGTLLNIVEKESRYYNFARWYTLLLRIQKNQFENIEGELDYFATENLIFMEKAENLAAELKKRKLID